MYEKRAKRLERLVNESEEWRHSCINLIPSENFLSYKARDYLTRDFVCRYAEYSRNGGGVQKHYYYKGTRYIKRIEEWLERELKSLFNCENIEARPISGTLANDIVFSAFVKRSDNVMAYSTNAGGHISHYKHGSLGKYAKRIIAIPLAKDGYHPDVEETSKLIKRYKPSVVVLGKSLFLFPEPIRELQQACKTAEARIIYDASHVLGLIAGKQFQNPLKEGAGIVTASTHKTFFGTQRGIIFGNINKEEWKRVDRAAFPGGLSNHHLNTLVGLLQATYEMHEFGGEYASQTIRNAKTLAKRLYENGLNVQGKDFGFTDSHQVAVDVSCYGGGERVAMTLERSNIIVNSNMLPTDESRNCKNPSGIRIGVQEMTRLGMREREMEFLGGLITGCINGKRVKNRVIELRQNFQKPIYAFDEG